jgi:hypothetical protein
MSVKTDIKVCHIRAIERLVAMLCRRRNQERRRTQVNRSKTCRLGPNQLSKTERVLILASLMQLMQPCEHHFTSAWTYTAGITNARALAWWEDKPELRLLRSHACTPYDSRQYELWYFFERALASEEKSFSPISCTALPEQTRDATNWLQFVFLYSIKTATKCLLKHSLTGHSPSKRWFCNTQIENLN